MSLPATGWSWGFQTHRYIAQNYSKHLPAVIDGLRAYDAIVDQKVNDPDIRRPSTPGESYRHFIDIDYYPEFFAGTLPHDRAALEALDGASTVLETGIVPWAVGEVVASLTQQFAAQRWGDAATTIADLCHYVGDATQPLHCTRNFDGQLTGNWGIHSRYETTMMAEHIGELTTVPAAVAHHPNVVDAMFDIVADSWTGVAMVINADNSAKAASGGAYDGVYYGSLWASTESLTRGRVAVATQPRRHSSTPRGGTPADRSFRDPAGARIPTPIRHPIPIPFPPASPGSRPRPRHSGTHSRFALAASVR